MISIGRKRNREDNELDSDEELEQELRRRYEHSMGGVPKWAQCDVEGSLKRDSDDDDAGQEIETEKTALLPPVKLDYKQYSCTGARHQTRVRSIVFNRNARILLSGGGDHTLRLWEVGIDNLVSLHCQKLQRFAPRCANFVSPSEDKVVATNGTPGKVGLALFDLNSMECRYRDVKCVLRKNYSRGFKWMAVSPNGQIIALVTCGDVVLLLNSSSLETIRELFVSTKEASSVCFTSDSQHVLIADVNGYIYLFHIGSSRCIQKFNDSGNFSGESVVTCSPRNKYFAVGSHTGIVNVYGFDSGVSTVSCKTEPIKTFTNVLVPVSFMRFNHSNEVLMFGSGYERNIIKLAHCASMTVFKNVPAQPPNNAVAKGYFNCADFSPNSGFMATGDLRGEINLYRLQHYKKY